MVGAKRLLQACLDLGRLPYPVALAARRLAEALQAFTDVVRTHFLLKDCFEAAVKYLAAVLLSDYPRIPGATPERNDELLWRMVVAFFASEEGRFVSGQVIRVDGGSHCWPA